MPMRIPSSTLALLTATAVAGGASGAAVIAVAADGGGGGTTTVTRDAPAAGTPVAETSSSAGLSAEQLYQRARGSVAFITASGGQEESGSGDPFGQQRGSGSGTATGSGFVVSRDGTIVTNQHVVDGASTIEVKVGGGETRPARLVGSDASSDLAVLKVDVGDDPLTPLALADSGDVAVGDPAFAIGSPYGLDSTLTTGVVSALQRDIQAPDGATITSVIQTDAALNPGNSGGPLLDADGRVIGVNAQIASSGGGSSSGGNVGIGFAIPSSTVQRVVSQIEQTGRATHASLGVSIGEGADGAGATLAAVSDGSGAADGGLRRGDVVTALDGTAVKDAAGLAAAVDAHRPGDEVEVTYTRGGERETASVTLGTRPAQPASSATAPASPQGEQPGATPDGSGGGVSPYGSGGGSSPYGELVP